MTAQWPRCRWCHAEIQAMPIGPAADSKPVWTHVSTGREECVGRSNMAEPIASLDERPLMTAVWVFVGKHRRLRRAFREVSQSRSSAMRRLNDYHDLIDELIEVFDGANPGHDELLAAIRKLRDYRKSSQAAGWR